METKEPKKVLKRGKYAVKPVKYEDSDEFFAESLLAIIDYYDCKQFDLSKNKFEMFLELTDRLINNRIKNYTDLFKTIEKSYHDQDIEKLLPIVKANAKDSNRRKLTPESGFSESLALFLNDKLADREFNPARFTSYSTCDKAIYDTIADRLQDIFGGYVFLGDFLNSDPLWKGGTNACTGLGNTFKIRGYDVQGYKGSFVINDDVKATVKEEYQDYILATYLRVAKIYCKSIFDVNSKITNEKFESFYEPARKFLMHCETLMTEKTKSKKEFIEAKKNFIEFFGKEIDDVKRRKTLENVKGEFNIKIHSVFRKIKNGKPLTDADTEIIQSFIKSVKAINSALKFKDANGVEYPTQYFLPNISHNISPSYMKRLLLDAEILKTKDGNYYFSEENRGLFSEDFNLIINKVIARAYAVTGRNTHSADISRFIDDEDDLDSVLRPYRVKINDVDYKSDEGFERLKDTVEGYISEYNLPHTKDCARSIASDCIRGNKPVSLDYLARGRDKV